MLVGTLNFLVWLLLLAVVAVLMAMVAWYLVSGEYSTCRSVPFWGGGGASCVHFLSQPKP